MKFHRLTSALSPACNGPHKPVNREMLSKAMGETLDSSEGEATEGLQKQREKLLPFACPPPPPSQAQASSKLTNRSFRSNGHRLQEDLDDTCSDPGRVSPAEVKVPQDLLDHVMRILGLGDRM